MDVRDSRIIERRLIATEGRLVPVVDKLVEKGIIDAKEAEDMFALLAAVSGSSIQSLSPSAAARPAEVPAIRRRGVPSSRKP